MLHATILKIENNYLLNCPKNRTLSFFGAVWGLKDADEMINSVGPDQTALGAD